MSARKRLVLSRVAADRHCRLPYRAWMYMISTRCGYVEAILPKNNRLRLLSCYVPSNWTSHHKIVLSLKTAILVCKVPSTLAWGGYVLTSSKKSSLSEYRRWYRPYLHDDIRPQVAL